MRHRRCGIHKIGALLHGALVLIFLGTAGFASAAPVSPVSYVPGEILVKFKPDATGEAVGRLHAKLGSVPTREIRRLGIHRIRIAPGLSVEEAAALYQTDPSVLYAEPIYIRRVLVEPNDADFNNQWGFHNTGQTVNATPTFRGRPDADMDLPEAWDLTTGSDQVIIAVIDSGVDYAHPDLASKIRQNPDPINGADDDGNGFVDDLRGWDFVDGDNDPMDECGHGTHVAGIAAADTDNGIGVSGVLPLGRIMPLKILELMVVGGELDCFGDTAVEIEAIDYAVLMLAKIHEDPSQINARMVINASFGAPGFSRAEQDAIAAARDAGILFVTAAGNTASDNDDFPIYPASYDLDNTIAVAASDADDRLAPFSNFGNDSVAVAAPGDCILSTTPTGSFFLEGKTACLSAVITADYAYLSGTSMAAPHVSGAAGLLLARDNALTPAQIKAILTLTADPLDSLKGLVASSGRLNAIKALLEETGSGLAGGQGGCGLPFGTVGPVERKDDPFRILLFFLTMFWPLLIPVLHRRVGRLPFRIHRRTGIAAAAGMIALVVLWPQSASAEDNDFAPDGAEFKPVHSLGLKLGYHRYDQSQYMDVNSGLLSRNDLSGLSNELEYDWRWSPDYSLSVTAGRYDGDADLKGVCCAEAAFRTSYLLLTPKFHAPAGPVEWYIGGGIGTYYFKRTIRGIINDRLSASLSGLHAVIGLEWPFLQKLSVFTEARYALAKVKSADAFDDALDVGGFNYSIGLSWRFMAPGRSF